MAKLLSVCCLVCACLVLESSSNPGSPVGGLTFEFRRLLGFVSKRIIKF